MVRNMREINGTTYEQRVNPWLLPLLQVERKHDYDCQSDETFSCVLHRLNEVELKPVLLVQTKKEIYI